MQRGSTLIMVNAGALLRFDLDARPWPGRRALNTKRGYTRVNYDHINLVGGKELPNIS